MTGITKRIGLAAAVLGLVAGVAGRAEATLVPYFDQASFQAAAGSGLATADFSSLSGQTFQTLNSAVSPVIPAGVTFSSTVGNADDLFVAPANFGGDPAINVPSLFANHFGTPLIADFAPNVTAVGSNVISFGSSSNIAITIREADGTLSVFNVTPPPGSAGFFGVTALNGESIAQISYTPPAGFTAGVNDFQFGQITAVPEPSTLIAGGLAGLFGLGVAYRRRKTRATA